jgi:prevent-host-death family protein
MAKHIYNLSEAKTGLSKLVDRAAAGEEIIISKAGTPRAKLVPLPVVRRKPGDWKGRVRMSKDFNDPLPKELLDAFCGRS